MGVLIAGKPRFEILPVPSAACLANDLTSEPQAPYSVVRELESTFQVPGTS